MNEIKLRTMHGMGDAIFAIPWVEELAENHDVVHLETPWPQFFDHLDNVRTYRLGSNLRTQRKNEERQEGFEKWKPKTGVKTFGDITYAKSLNTCQPFWEAQGNELKRQGLPVTHEDYFLTHPHWKWTRPTPGFNDRKTVIVRPNSRRREWNCGGRNCDSKSLQYAVDLAREAGFRTVLIADFKEGEEWWEFEPVETDVAYTQGEFTLEEVIDMTLACAFVISPVGFMGSLCPLLATPCLLLHGGRGKHNRPAVIGVPSRRSPIHVLPDNYCFQCSDPKHNCDRTTNPGTIKHGFSKILEMVRGS